MEMRLESLSVSIVDSSEDDVLSPTYTYRETLKTQFSRQPSNIVGELITNVTFIRVFVTLSFISSVVGKKSI